jgi:hypothetical protein
MQLLADDEWVVILAYLSDIFVLLKQLHREIQGKTENTLSNTDKMQRFCGKLKLQLQYITIGPSEKSPTVCSLVAGSD